MIKALLIILIVIFLSLLIFCLYAFNLSVWTKTLPLPKFIKRMMDGCAEDSFFERECMAAVSEFEKMPLEAVELRTKEGLKLKGNILIPEKSNGRLIIACHGARSSGLGEFCFMRNYFYENGFTVIMPEHRGCGKSDGNYMGYGTHESEDTLLWLDYAKRRFPNLSVFLLGVSMGGATVLIMSNKISRDSIKGIIADCPYTSQWEEFSYQLRHSFRLPVFPFLYICNFYSRIFAGYSMKDAAPIKAVRNSRVPILFIHGMADDFVPFSMQAELYEECSSKKSLLAVEGAVHARSYYTAPAVYEAALEEFFNKYDK